MFSSLNIVDKQSWMKTGDEKISIEFLKLAPSSQWEVRKQQNYKHELKLCLL